MTGITPGVSLLGQSNAQITRLNAMRRQMDDLERQIGTQKKYSTLTGFGLDAGRVLQLHANLDQTQTFSDNIDGVVRNITTMTSTMTRTIDLMNNIVSLLQSQPRDSDFDATLVHNQAQQALEFLSDAMNLDINGRYLFAGTDSQTAPVADLNALTSGFATQMTNWMAGTITTTQILTNTDSFSGASLGLSPTVSSARNISVRISTDTELSYGAIADRSGLQEALRALGFMANLRAPDPSVDIPTDADLSTVVDHILVVARNAVSQLQDSQGRMSSTLTLAQSIRETHQLDLNLYHAQIDKAENSDAAEVIAQLQALQTQLTASYETTRLMSQMSLANYIS